MSNSRDERLALAALLEETGPEAATLCTGWLTGDLAAHLVLRERRPDAAAGVMGGPIAPYTARVQRHYVRKHTFDELIALFRNGPPRLSPFALPGADEQANTVEYFVHHEDVRRAQPDWQPRAISDGLSDALWRRMKGARFFLRKSPVGVELARDDGDNRSGPYRVTVKNATPTVTVIGTPGELTMWATGRTSAAHVRFDGTGEAITALKGLAVRRPSPASAARARLRRPRDALAGKSPGERRALGCSARGRAAPGALPAPAWP